VKKLGNIRVFRCKICRDPYIGEETPSRCPFCGALGCYFIPAEEWNPSEYIFKISNISKANLKAALELELGNTAFYLCAMNVAQANGDEYAYAKFKALKKVENEHADAILKFLKIEKPQLKPVPCSKDYETNTKEGWKRENRAIKSYAKFAEEAPELQLKQFFESLVEIETDHLDLHAKNLKVNLNNY
jgi:rubrerythrin